MAELEDIRLVRECLAGNTNAFEIIVDRYQKPIFNVALKMLSDFESAQDIVQTVFIKAFEKLDMFNPKYKFFSWIYRMAVNESINFLNQRKHHESLDRSIVAKDKSPEEQYLNIELQEKIQDALMMLQIDSRAVIVLRHFEELSYNEIGFILDIPEKKVKSRLFTARQQLKTVLVKRKRS